MSDRTYAAKSEINPVYCPIRPKPDVHRVLDERIPASPWRHAQRCMGDAEVFVFRARKLHRAGIIPVDDPPITNAWCQVLANDSRQLVVRGRCVELDVRRQLRFLHRRVHCRWLPHDGRQRITNSLSVARTGRQAIGPRVHLCRRKQYSSVVAAQRASNWRFHIYASLTVGKHFPPQNTFMIPVAGPVSVELGFL